MNHRKLLIKILLAFAMLLLGLLATLGFIQTAHSRAEAEKLRAAEAQIIANYKANIDKKTDADALTKTGLRQLNINLPGLALITLKRAVEVQKNYRDAWLALGLAQFKTGDIGGALISFQSAEKLDPINAKTYELLRIAYETVGDASAAAKADEKYKFLSKTIDKY